MTMSMCGPGLTTTRYNGKQKKSKSKRLQQAQSDHEAWLKSIGVGKVKLPTDAKGKRVGLNKIPDYSTGPRMTGDNVAAHGTAKERTKYTGSEIAGVVLNHKSNYEPVRKDNMQAAIDSAKMRRS